MTSADGMRVMVATTSGSMRIDASVARGVDGPACTVRPASVPRTPAAETNMASAIGRSVSDTLLLVLDDVAHPDRQAVAVDARKDLELLALVHAHGQRFADRLVEQHQIAGLQRDEVAQRNDGLAQLD